MAFGAWFLIDPISPLAAIGITATGDPAATEFRAFYGGLEVGLGALLIAAAFKPAWRGPGLWLVLASNLGIALGRLFGIAVDGVWVPFFVYALVWELGFVALAAAGLWRGESSSD